jgi:hypothetical protein
MTTDDKPKSLKIKRELHHELDKLRAELSVGMGKMVNAILWDAIKNGPKAVLRMMHRSDAKQPEQDAPANTKMAEPPRKASPSRTASASAKRRNAR